MWMTYDTQGSLNALNDKHYGVKSNYKISPRPPDEKVQFLKHESVITGDEAVLTITSGRSLVRNVNFVISHRFDARGSFSEVQGIDFGEVPARYIGDGFAPWALLKKSTLTLHAAAVAINETAIIIIGYHDSGKTTLASTLVEAVPGARMVSDDQLTLTPLDDGKLGLCAAFWDESCAQNPTVVKSASVFFLDRSDWSLAEQPIILQQMQFVAGAYCSPQCWDSAVDLLQKAEGSISYNVVPARPDAENIISRLSLEGAVS